MAQNTLNLGILAHVDAGKTTLTERLLYAAGVIDEVGSVDAGTTQTDSLALEQQRGITIKSAVTAFEIDDVAVNLVDTPGHPDFIAEVERVLSVLDGAVLVISAVEGVQSQTPLLMRALQRLRVPTLIFVNKIDRPGASDDRVLQAISERLTPAIVRVGCSDGLGTPAAEFSTWGAGDAGFRARLAEVLAERDDQILAGYVDDDGRLSYRRLRRTLAAQTKRAQLHPVFLGSAITGAGIDALMSGIAELLPPAAGDPEGDVSGTVFKIERHPGGARSAYVRMFSGTVGTRDRVQFGRCGEGKVTAISVFAQGAAEARDFIAAGEIGKLSGLAEIQIGDTIGTQRLTAAHHFAPPTLQAVVVPRNPHDKGRLRVALNELAEQDPLINVRQEDSRREISVSLYGEVQKEVIEATLASDFGIDVGFRETTTICIERPAGSGAAVERIREPSNPFLATVGLRIDPAPADSGVEFRLEIGPRSVPLYIYKSAENFKALMADYVRLALREGLFGWQVTDCTVTMTDSGYAAPSSTAADFRKLTALVLMRALERAKTRVCEPIVHVTLEVPAETVGAVTTVVARLGAVLQLPSLQGRLATIETALPAARVQDLQWQLPGLTGGEGVFESSFGGYRAVGGAPPTRRRLTANPLNRQEYLRSTKGRHMAGPSS